MAGDVPDIIEAVAIRPRHVDDDEVRRFSRDGVQQRLAFPQPDDRSGAGDDEVRFDDTRPLGIGTGNAPGSEGSARTERSA